jgi:hypothetical protein
LTFVLAELEGRYYGGGVLELTPNEFKDMSIPYYENSSDEQFNTVDQLLQNDTDINEILSFTNSILIPPLDISRLEEIRIKLFNRRIKNTVKEQDVDIEIFDLKPIPIKKSPINVLVRLVSLVRVVM